MRRLLRRLERLDLRKLRLLSLVAAEMGRPVRVRAERASG
jgi:hypothetical protein